MNIFPEALELLTSGLLSFVERGYRGLPRKTVERSHFESHAAFMHRVLSAPLVVTPRHGLFLVAERLIGFHLGNEGLDHGVSRHDGRESCAAYGERLDSNRLHGFVRDCLKYLLYASRVYFYIALYCGHHISTSMLRISSQLALA